MATHTVTVVGNTIAGTRQRARLDPDAPGFSGTYTVMGGAAVEHSANQDNSAGTSVASGATSGAITTTRWLRSVGTSQIRCDSCRVEGVVVA
jgi:hypothetical protein